MSDIDYHQHFQTVLEDLVRTTHCHGCGKKYNVCFFGYVKEYCMKSCYYRHELHDNMYDTNSEEYDEENMDRLPHDAMYCGWCNNEVVSLANSIYHHDYRTARNPCGTYWPMLDYHIPCYNTCIKERPTVTIKGYNTNLRPNKK
jgi:hypothetical protein